MRVSLILSLASLVFNLVDSRGLPVSRRDDTNRTTPLLTNYPGMAPLPKIPEKPPTNARNFSNIQGDIFVGMRKPKETFMFFRINNAKLFKGSLKLAIPIITSTTQLLGPTRIQPLAFVNIAFSSSGLKALGINDDLGDSNFAQGQFADASSLGDDTSLWESSYKSGSIHGVFLVGSDNQARVDIQLLALKLLFGVSVSEVTRVTGSARPGNQAGHEHFGYLDGVSNPLIESLASTRLPGQAVVPDGIIITGRNGDTVSRPSWAADGSFLVFRKLKQLVPEFNTFTRQNALTRAFDSVTNKNVSLSAAAGAELMGARMIGRWKSGAPVDLAPLADDPALGADPSKNNNFDFSHPGMDINSDQSRCPFASHVRKTRPRVDLEFGGPENTVNQAIRAGIPYGGEVSAGENKSGKSTQDRGLAFVEYQSSVANGFITHQVVWANNAQFPPVKASDPGLDPIIAQNPLGGPRDRQVFGLDPTNPAKSYSMLPFVVPLGGEYFFSPSISTLKTKLAA